MLPVIYLFLPLLHSHPLPGDQQNIILDGGLIKSLHQFVSYFPISDFAGLSFRPIVHSSVEFSLGNNNH